MLRRLFGISTFALLLAPVLASAADFTLTAENTTVKFVGTKTGGKHDGGFKTVTGKASVENNDLTTLKITLDIDTTSLYTDNDKLTNHLKSPDFFGVKANPTAKFAATKVEKADTDYKITGNLTLLGKTKEISFPAKLAVTADDGLTLSSSFSIDRTQWGMTFGQGKVNNDVKLTVSVKAK
jgi:polyisoprenoid-binding protein YceI